MKSTLKFFCLRAESSSEEYYSSSAPATPSPISVVPRARHSLRQEPLYGPDEEEEEEKEHELLMDHSEEVMQEEPSVRHLRRG